jgi:hypothetical protein
MLPRRQTTAKLGPAICPAAEAFRYRLATFCIHNRYCPCCCAGCCLATRTIARGNATWLCSTNGMFCSPCPALPQLLLSAGV